MSDNLGTQDMVVVLGTRGKFFAEDNLGIALLGIEVVEGNLGTQDMVVVLGTRGKFFVEDI